MEANRPGNKKPRILQIISGFAVEGPLGGIERFGMALSESLNRGRVSPIVCGLWSYGTPFEHQTVESLRIKGVEAFIAAEWDATSPYRSFRQALTGIKRAISSPVDIIHSHCQFGDVAALFLKKPLGASRLIRTVHNEIEWGKRPERRMLLTNMVYPLLYDAEFGVANQVVENLDRRPIARLTDHRALLMHNALDIERITDVRVDKLAVRGTLGFTSDNRLIGTIGRLVKQKGHSYLLRAMPTVLARIPEARLMVIGDGELEADLIEQAQQLGIKDAVLFMGPRNDIVELLHIMDLFVNPSLWEGLPTVVLESMAARVPVVATRVSGIDEVLVDSVSGQLVPPGNSELLASSIMEMLSTSDEERQSMTERAYQTVNERFSITLIAEQHLRFYLNLLDK